MSEQPITPQTLMLGHYVTDEWASHGNIWPVTNFNSRLVYYGTHRAKFKCRYDNIRPVEPTQDILIKMGFEPEHKVTGTRYCLDGYYVYTTGIVCVTSISDKTTIINNKPLRYVHQLQVLFLGLTGTKLKIES